MAQNDGGGEWRVASGCWDVGRWVGGRVGVQVGGRVCGWVGGWAGGWVRARV